MKRLVEFPLEDNSSIVMEIDDQEAVGVQSTQRPGRLGASEPERAPQTFEEALSKIRPATEKVVEALKGLAQEPDEIEMTFGFSLSAVAGVVIAAASAQANYTVTLRWKGDRSANSPQSSSSASSTSAARSS